MEFQVASASLPAQDGEHLHPFEGDEGLMNGTWRLVSTFSFQVPRDRSSRAKTVPSVGSRLPSTCAALFCTRPTFDCAVSSCFGQQKQVSPSTARDCCVFLLLLLLPATHPRHSQETAAGDIPSPPAVDWHPFLPLPAERSKVAVLDSRCLANKKPQSLKTRDLSTGPLAEAGPLGSRSAAEVAGPKGSIEILFAP